MFFATGVEETANAAVVTAQRMNEMAQADRARVQGAGRIAGSALQVQPCSPPLRRSRATAPVSMAAASESLGG